MATISNYILTFISLVFIQSSSSTITTLSTNCGNLIITCNEPDIRCCQGACCSLLSQYQNREPLADEAETGAITPYYYIAPAPIAPLSIPQIGEACSTKQARGERCAGIDTKCRFDDYDAYGYLLGVCCVENECDGCIKDSDCCRYDGVCNNGRCSRDLPPRTISIITDTNTENEVQNIEDNTPALVDDGLLAGNDAAESNTAHDEINEVQSARSVANIKELDLHDVDQKELDLHEENRSKPNYELWVSLTTNMALFVLVLFISLCALNCWLYRNYYDIRNKKRTMNANGRMLGMHLEQNRECDVNDVNDVTDFHIVEASSDSTDYEESMASA